MKNFLQTLCYHWKAEFLLTKEQRRIGVKMHFNAKNQRQKIIKRQSTLAPALL